MNAPATVVTATFLIPTDHPALPGHFPGHPLVPGVVVLDQVIQALEASGVPSARLRKLRHVKFVEPLLPGQEATIAAETGAAALSFSVTRGGNTIAKGSFEVGDEIAR